MNAAAIFKLAIAAVFYLWLFWSTFKSNPGNRVIRCGVIAVGVFVAAGFATKIPRLPWMIGAALMMLAFFLSLLTLFFLLQQGYQALRRRRRQT